MGVPDVSRYYLAAIVSTLVQLHHHKTSLAWNQIETAHTEGLPLHTLAWTPADKRPHHKTICPTTATTLKVWDKLVKKQQPRMRISTAFQLQALTILIPGFEYKFWHSHGVFCLSQVLDNGQMIDYDTLHNKYNLPTATFFSYLQLKSWVHKHYDNTQVQGHLLTEIERLCLATKPPQRLLSTLYSLIGPNDCIEQFKCIRAWERELGQTLTPEDWTSTLRAHKTLTLNTAHIEI
ncbi:Hypothetical predicted protein, partial [Pelobates cultripes]